MDEAGVREHLQAHADALMAGDIGKASEEMSRELRQNLGPIVAMLPMPLTEANIESVDATPTGFKAVLHLVGEHSEIRLETRWKERDGRPTMVEASHIPEEPPPPEEEPEEPEA